MKDAIILKSTEEIEGIRKSSEIVAGVLKELKRLITTGINTYELDRYAEELIHKKGAIPAFKGYKGYPCALCTSINEEVVHGIPSKKRILRKGDIIGIDCGVFYEDFYGDAAITFPVGRVNEEAMRLMDVTRNSLMNGIEMAQEGYRLHDISHAIQSTIEREGFSVVRKFVGHGIGRQLHEPPQIPNFGRSGSGVKLKAGMTLAIEPMINQGESDVKILKDGWTAVTTDRSLSAHFEHTIAITRNGPIILTI